MALQNPIWPSFAALDQVWDSPAGHALEVNKAKHVATLVKPHIQKRPKILLIGPASPTLSAELQNFGPAQMFQAYPPAIGLRPGPCPALLMDTDLPPFSRGHFDLVVLSYVLEYRSTPLALLSLAYEFFKQSRSSPMHSPPPIWGPVRHARIGRALSRRGLKRPITAGGLYPLRPAFNPHPMGTPPGHHHGSLPPAPAKAKWGEPIFDRLRALLKPRTTPGVALNSKDA